MAAVSTTAQTATHLPEVLADILDDLDELVEPVALSAGSHEFRGSGVMAHPGASVKLVLAKAGVDKVKTPFGEDYMKVPDTIGEDNTLTLNVVVG